MPSALARLEAILLARTYVPPHAKVVNGKAVKVDGYWRKSSGRSKTAKVSDLVAKTEQPTGPYARKYDVVDTELLGLKRLPADKSKELNGLVDRRRGPFGHETVTIKPEDDIYTQQKYVGAKFTEKQATFELPAVRLADGKIVLTEGNHRAANAKYRGEAFDVEVVYRKSDHPTRESKIDKVSDALSGPVEESKTPPLSGGHVDPPMREALPERAPAKRPSDAVDFADQRKKGPKVKVDLDSLDAALEAAGVDTSKDPLIKVRLRDVAKQGEQGSMRQIGPNAYRVIVKVVPKDKLEDRHLYVMNNSLVHELRHVTQAQKTKGFGSVYSAMTKKFGYYKNPFEIEARFYGRLADHTGKKDTGPAGAAKGKDVWAFRNV